MQLVKRICSVGCTWFLRNRRGKKCRWIDPRKKSLVASSSLTKTGISSHAVEWTIGFSHDIGMAAQDIHRATSVNSECYEEECYDDTHFAVRAHRKMNGEIGKDVREGNETFKVLLVGGSSVGKTCILRRFVDGEFPSKSKATLGLDFKIRCLHVENQIVKMQLWDTSGQERFRSMTQAYYRGAAGVMLVYDVTETSTLQGLKGWLADINTYAPEDVDVIILGNKCDNVEQRVVPTEAGEEFARSNTLKFFETSAHDDTNIAEAFEALAKLLARKVSEKRKRANSAGITSPSISSRGGGTKCTC